MSSRVTGVSWGVPAFRSERVHLQDYADALLGGRFLTGT
jgi:hypothetical protein